MKSIISLKEIQILTEYNIILFRLFYRLHGNTFYGISYYPLHA